MSQVRDQDYCVACWKWCNLEKGWNTKTEGHENTPVLAVKLPFKGLGLSDGIRLCRACMRSAAENKDQSLIGWIRWLANRARECERQRWTQYAYRSGPDIDLDEKDGELFSEVDTDFLYEDDEDTVEGEEFLPFRTDGKTMTIELVDALKQLKPPEGSYYVIVSFRPRVWHDEYKNSWGDLP